MTLRSQGAAEQLAGLLSVLLPGEDTFYVGLSAEDHIELDAATAELIVDMLGDLMPECWSARTYYGYPRPNECSFPSAVCFSCANKGKRLPTRVLDERR